MVTTGESRTVAEAGSPRWEATSHAPTGLIAFDASLRIVLANETARQMLGLQRHAIGAPAPAVLANTPAAARDWAARWLPLIRGEGASEFQTVLADGSGLVVARSGESDGTVLVSLIPATSDSLQVTEDPLTGLADRRGFHRRLAHLCGTESHRTAIVLVDLDRFKSVNDTMGHSAGDALLRLVAQRLRGTFRHADVVSRLGGEEFAVALAAGPDLPSLAERLVTMLSRPYLVERQTAVIGASVGIAMAPQHGIDPMSLVQAADLALVQAKAEGKGVVRIFNEELGERARSKHALADDLRRAIPLQQFDLYFQPQVSLKTGKLTGFEALVRWRHPKQGLISPTAFIPLAEESGLICSLGEWVLFEACRQAKAWPPGVRVAVNVSAQQLQDRDRLPRAVAAALEANGLEPSRLEIEVTESALISEDVALDVLTRIRATGVHLSMDDFGTGYSSLSQLRRFPFDKLKIDRSFVQDLGCNGKAEAVIRAITALGISLGLSITAEGVETVDQEAVCRADGCTDMQGFLISKPVPADEVHAIIERYL